MESETTETTLDRLNQLSAAGAAVRGEVETLVAEVVALRGRLADAERALEAVQAGRAEDVERMERLIGERRVEGRLDGIEERLGAAQTTGQRTAERVETVAAEVARLSRFDAALDTLRRDVADQLASHVEALRAERSASEARTERRAADLAATLRELSEAVEDLAPVSERIDALERARKELQSDAQRNAADVAALAASRTELTDAVQRGVADMAARAGALTTEVEGLRGELSTWQARIEQQVTTLDSAKRLVAEASAKGDELLAAQREAAEAQRIFEGRVDATLAAVRRETADEWTAFMAQREREREQAGRALREELAERDEALQAAIAAVDERFAALGVEIERRRQTLETDILDLRQMLLAALARWRDGLDDLIKDSEDSIPADAKPHLVAERRRALRRSLRAARDDPR